MHTSDDPILRAVIDRSARLDAFASGVARSVGGAPREVERPMAAVAQNAVFAEALLSALRARLSELRAVAR